MQFNIFFVEVGDKSLSFEFDSVGNKGKIRKRILFQAFDKKSSFYNLAFGDIDNNNNIDDTVVSNNGDSRKILTTVVYCAGVFFEKYPEAIIYIQGSTDSRTRLYRMAINNNLHLLSIDFEVKGYNDGWHNFFSGIEYEAFLIEKNLNLTCETRYFSKKNIFVG